MKTIDLILQPTNGYITSFIRNTMDGSWELEVGIPNKWVYNDNDFIKCEVINKNEVGRLMRISSKSSSIVIDDLISFVEIIINTNKKIEEKENEFNAQMELLKKGLEEKATEFFKELDTLKENSFKSSIEGKTKVKPSTKKDKNIDTIDIDNKSLNNEE